MGKYYYFLYTIFLYTFPRTESVDHAFSRILLFVLAILYDHTHFDGELWFFHDEIVVLTPQLFSGQNVGHGRYSDQTMCRQLVHVFRRFHVRVDIFF